jgi:hypothetical protein
MFPSQPQPQSDSPKHALLAWTLLRKYPDRMQVLTELCEKTKMDPAQAEALLRRVEASWPKDQPLPGVSTRSNLVRTRLILIVALSVFMMIGAAVMVFLLAAR